jgi:hypothetical protein
MAGLHESELWYLSQVVPEDPKAAQVAAAAAGGDNQEVRMVLYLLLLYPMVA